MAADRLQAFGVELFFEFFRSDVVVPGKFDILKAEAARLIYSGRDIFGELFAQAVKLQANGPFETRADSGLIFIERPDVGQPFLKPVMPGSERDSVTRPDASPMSASPVDVQLVRDSDLEARTVELDRLPRVKRVIDARACQKGRGRVLRGNDVHRRRPARIDHADEIGAAAFSFNRVSRVGLSAIEPDVRERGESA